jgi:uncharacterized protein YegP (UPF0339 family)
MTTKKAAKKKPVVKKGVHLYKSSKGFSAHIHSSNGNKLAVLTGYNTKANAHKGLKALYDALLDAWNYGATAGQFVVTDHTAPKKAATRKR